MSLRETVEKIRSNPTPANEETAKFQILAPILADLSWDTRGPEVLFEHPVGGKKGGGKADIALKAHGRIRALIEAKAPGARLQDHVAQVLGYAFHEGVDICALSDGIRWWLYLPRESGPPPERRFAVLDLGTTGDPVDQVSDDLTTFLGRESLMSGRSKTRAEQVLGALREAAKLANEMPRIWRHMLEAPDNDLVDLVGQRVYEELSLRPDRGQIVAAMRNEPIPAAESGTPAPPEAATETAVPPDKPPQIKKPTKRPVAILLWKERHLVRYHKDVLLAVADRLHELHRGEFDERVAPLKSGTWRYLARDRQLVRPISVGRTASGHYVDVNLSAATIKRRAIDLLEAFGYGEADLEYLYE